MAEPDGFLALIDRVRAGDGAAAEELVRRYEPMVRRVARARLSDPRLGRLLESMDICQSVMASFFVRVALGQYDLANPEQLAHLLARMTRNKLINQAEQHRAARRDVRRLDGGGGPIAEVEARGQVSPSRAMAARELLDAARARFTEEERGLLERRGEGADWASLASERGTTPEALRKRMSRAIDRVARDIGLDGSGDV